MASENRIHPLLATLVDLAEQGAITASITLQIHGAVVTGTLVRASEHMKGIREQIAGSAPAMADGLKKAQEMLDAQPTDQALIDESPFVHLREATVWLGGTPVQVPWWAGHLRAVDGWLLGTLNFKQ